MEKENSNLEVDGEKEEKDKKDAEEFAADKTTFFAKTALSTIKTTTI